MGVSYQMHICVPLACLVPEEVRRGYQIFWNWRYSWLCYHTGAGSKIKFPGKAASALNW